MLREGGAINPATAEAKLKATTLYEEIRRRRSDHIYVSRNTGFSLEQCKVVKDYVFCNQHELNYGYFSFDPDIIIAGTWLRLSNKKPSKFLPFDNLFMPHELTELLYILHNNGVSVVEAHEYAEKSYNYSLAAKQYYTMLGIDI